MSWDQAQKEALARASTSEVLKWVLELRHSLFPSPFRLAQHDSDIDVLLESDAPADASTTQTFIGTGLRLREPDENNQPDPTVTIEIDGLSGALQPFLRPAIVSGEPVLMTLRGLMYDVNSETVSQALKIYHLQLRSATTSMTTVIGVFAYTNAANQPFPSQKYDAISNPGLV